MKYILPAILLLITLGSEARADSFSSPQAARVSIDKVMAAIAADNVDGGLSQIKPYSALPPAEFDAALGQIKYQLSPMASRFGKSIGYEFIKEDKVGNSFIRFTYLQKYEKHAIRWFFIFYDSGTGLMLNALFFRDNMQDLFPN